MKRRQLIKLLLALPGVFPAFGRPMPRPQALTVPLRNCALITQIQVSPVAGFQYYAGEKLWPKLRIDDLVQLKREPDNPYDKQAVALLWQGQKLGYLPRRSNTSVAQMLDRQIPLQTSITSLNESNNPWERVSVNIELLQNRKRIA